MARPATGTIDPVELADGTRAFHLRFRANGRRERLTLHERRGCVCGCGGGWSERAARTELGDVLARVRVGVWQPAEPPADVQQTAERQMPTFGEYSSWWLEQRIDGVIGEKPLSENSVSDYRWKFGHLVPFYAEYPLDEINAELLLAFKSAKLREARELREAIAAGADLRDHRGRRRKPLGASSIRKLIAALATILDDAVEDGHIEHHGARGKRMRVHVPKPTRTFLEGDELAALIDAATEQDTQAPVDDAGELGPTTALVAHLSQRASARSRSPASWASRSPPSPITCAERGSTQVVATPPVE